MSIHSDCVFQSFLKFWGTPNAACPKNVYVCHSGHACHGFTTPELENRNMMTTTMMMRFLDSRLGHTGCALVRLTPCISQKIAEIASS